MERKIAWEKYDDLKNVFDFNEDYKKYISDCKTERECVTESIKLAEKYGYRDLKDVIANNETLKAGDKVYAAHMGKTLALFNIGTEPFEKGLNILGAHIDSPRIDIKQNPLYEDHDLVLLDTHYYGGIKKYQWVTLPLALHGVVIKKDGTVIKVVIGEDDTDPVVGISDLLIHLSADQMTKPAGKVIEGEDLNVTVGSIPSKTAEKEKSKQAILDLLKEKYNIEEEDFKTAELEVVPAGKARDYGLDRSMVTGYGHDDSVCAYTSLAALLDTETVERTAVCLLTDKEEVGSIGATGAHSKFFENAVAEIMNCMNDYTELKVRRALFNSCMLSSDVSAGFDPNYPGVNELKNTAFLGYGLCFNKFLGSRGKGGSNDANPEFLVKVFNAMDKDGVSFQTCELGRVDQGGGGTIAYISAQYGMEVVDAGVAVQNMHAPWEVVSKVDVYEAYLGYKAFIKYVK